ncbi:hypothetical protein FISHEDRAFT_52689 [Fistulina hepatica ATCC 64428]|nr:hypothetical protein FISHEDRAFT_52689 [Fistulina hepatica ATCC 64428]
MKSRNFEAWISSWGRRLPEFRATANLDGSQVDCWIPATGGMPFKVHWKDLGGGVNSCGYISIDGVTVPGRFLPGKGETYRESVRTSIDTQAPFIFKETGELKATLHFLRLI